MTTTTTIHGAPHGPTLETPRAFPPPSKASSRASRTSRATIASRTPRARGCVRGRGPRRTWIRHQDDASCARPRRESRARASSPRAGGGPARNRRKRPSGSFTPALAPRPSRSPRCSRFADSSLWARRGASLRCAPSSLSSHGAPPARVRSSPRGRRGAWEKARRKAAAAVGRPGSGTSTSRTRASPARTRRGAHPPGATATTAATARPATTGRGGRSGPPRRRLRRRRVSPRVFVRVLARAERRPRRPRRPGLARRRPRRPRRPRATRRARRVRPVRGPRRRVRVASPRRRPRRRLLRRVRVRPLDAQRHGPERLGLRVVRRG